jgi:hypothetical protein
MIIERYSFRKADGEMPTPDEKGGGNHLFESKEEAVKSGLAWGADMVCLMGQRPSGVWEIIGEEPIEP